MGDVSHYLDVPPLVVFSLMAIVLVRQHRDKQGYGRLWAIGLGLIALEGFARMVYLAQTQPLEHSLAHIVALDAYFLAGVTLLQSASGRFSSFQRPILYLAGCSAPFVALLSCYGAGVKAESVYLGICVVGLAGSLGLSELLGRPRHRLVLHSVMWVAVLASVLMHDPRQAVYTSLAMTYALTGWVFLRGLPRAVTGRVVVVLGFWIWALCFLIHAWVAKAEPAWQPLLNDVWDMQKFVVMFGLLIVSLEEHSRRAEYQALHDALTGLANRRLFDDRLEQALVKAKREGSRVLLFNLDLNGFKQVNDTRGHAVGDELLCAVAGRLRSVVRRSDTLARIGGDEFHLIASGFASMYCETVEEEIALLRKQGEILVAKLRDAVEHPMKLRSGKGAIDPSVSIGFAIYPLDAVSPDELCLRADSAMYEEKRDRAERLAKVLRIVS